MEFLENIALARMSSYSIGGPARYFFAPTSVEEIVAVLEFKKKLGNVPGLLILGGGTNLLIKDEGFDGVVLQPRFMDLKCEGRYLTAGAGVLMEDVLRFALDRKLSGLEWAGGLPGTLGGAVRGNAGCFGGETKDAIVSVKSFSIAEGRVIERSKTECEFGYRTSVFKTKGDEIVLSATFALTPGDPEIIQAAMNEKIAYRKSRHPLEYPNIGSIFKNVDLNVFPSSRAEEVAHVIKKDPFPVIPAAHLLSLAGLKGVSFGGAMFSPKHPNFIVNVLNAKAEDVRTLIALAKDEVKKRFDVVLEQEVQNV